MKTGVFNEIYCAATTQTTACPRTHSIQQCSLSAGESRPCRAVPSPASGDPSRAGSGSALHPRGTASSSVRGPAELPGRPSRGAPSLPPGPAPPPRPRSLRRSRNDIAGTRGRRGSEATRYGGAARPNPAGSEVRGGLDAE